MNRRLSLVVFLLGACLGLGEAARALAQDELRKDQPTSAKSAPPAASTGKPTPSSRPVQPDVPPSGAMIDKPIAVLHGLDKITARVRQLEVKVGQSVPFGTLSIKVDSCRKAAPEDTPESAAFLEITDTKPGEAPRKVFSGWMFASSPALSGLDHPVYDVWVLDCAGDATGAAGQ